MSARRVVVIGGGLAGITAALDCADGGADVTLLEVRPRLGGAAYSFEREGLWLDNGQHIFLRCCTAYRALLARLGSERCVAIQPRLEIPVLSPDRARAMLRRGSLPAPLHLAGALMRYSHLTPTQRLSSARAAIALRGVDPQTASGTLGEWLSEHGQSQAAVAALWDLIALPTLNLPAGEASLALGAFVLRTGLLERSDAGDIGFHLRPLSETLGDPAQRALAEAAVEVRLGARAEAVEPVEGGGPVMVARHVSEWVPDEDGSTRMLQQGLRVRVGGAEIEADAVVCAVPHERASVLLEPLLGSETGRWAGLGESPIVNVHVVYDRRVCDLPFAAGVGTPVQYIFDRTSAAGLRRGQYLAISLSGAQEQMRLSGEELRERYLTALAELFPRARDAVVQSFHVSREHAATFRAGAGSEALRPVARTGLPGLALAGAWTATGWPATLEGAVLSGHAAAREVLA